LQTGRKSLGGIFAVNIESASLYFMQDAHDLPDGLIQQNVRFE
jgi:hypothetical protein